MRDINRIQPMYQVMSEYHEHFPDLRFLQLMNNYMTWLIHKHGIDPFYIEDEKHMAYFEEYMTGK